MAKKPAAVTLAQLEEYTSPSGAKLYMTPDGKVFGSAEAAAQHVYEHTYEFEAQAFLDHVSDHPAHYLSPQIGERAMRAQLRRMKQILVWYLTWKAGGPIPEVRSARGPKPKKDAKGKSKAATAAPAVETTESPLA